MVDQRGAGKLACHNAHEEHRRADCGRNSDAAEHEQKTSSAAQYDPPGQVEQGRRLNFRACRQQVGDHQDERHNHGDNGGGDWRSQNPNGCLIYRRLGR